MDREADSDEIVDLGKQLQPILYAVIFYHASVKLAPKLVKLVSKWFGYEIDAEFK